MELPSSNSEECFCTCTWVTWAICSLQHTGHMLFAAHGTYALCSTWDICSLQHMGQMCLAGPRLYQMAITQVRYAAVPNLRFGGRVWVRVCLRVRRWHWWEPGDDAASTTAMAGWHYPQGQGCAAGQGKGHGYGASGPHAGKVRTELLVRCAYLSSMSSRLYSPQQNRR